MKKQNNINSPSMFSLLSFTLIRGIMLILQTQFMLAGMIIMVIGFLFYGILFYFIEIVALFLIIFSFWISYKFNKLEKEVK